MSCVKSELGAVLVQQYNITICHISNVSGMLTVNKSRYAQIEKEQLGMVLNCPKPYL